MEKKRNRWQEFFQDQRGNFNVFTCIALAAIIELLALIPLARAMDWAPLSDREIWALLLVYSIAALGDYLLGIFLNKMPATLNLDTGGGDASLAAGPGAEATTETPNQP